MIITDNHLKVSVLVHEPEHFCYYGYLCYSQEISQSKTSSCWVP